MSCEQVMKGGGGWVYGEQGAREKEGSGGRCGYRGIKVRYDGRYYVLFS